MLKVITATHGLFFICQIVSNICYFNLIECCKTSEGPDSEGLLIQIHVKWQFKYM